VYRVTQHASTRRRVPASPVAALQHGAEVRDYPVELRAQQPVEQVGRELEGEGPQRERTRALPEHAGRAVRERPPAILGEACPVAIVGGVV